MKVLLATRNQDKFEIVRQMVERVIPDAFLISLDEANIKGEVVEVGTIQQRAIQKAEYFSGRLKEIKRSQEFDAVLAIDDGFSVGENEASPNSKELTDRILQSEWPEGEPVTLVRAFSLIKGKGQAKVETTLIPFTFLGNSSKVSRERGKYPLSMVLAPKGKKVAVFKLSKEEQNYLNLTYSAEAIKRLFE